MANTHDDQRHLVRALGGGHRGQDERQHELAQGDADEQALAVDGVGQGAADHREQQQRAELGEQDHPDERGRLGEVVGQRPEHHVLHPRADVGQERAGEHPAEHLVAQRGPCRARSERAVAVDERVLDLLGRAAVVGGRVLEERIVIGSGCGRGCGTAGGGLGAHGAEHPIGASATSNPTRGQGRGGPGRELAAHPTPERTHASIADATSCTAMAATSSPITRDSSSMPLSRNRRPSSGANRIER